MYKELFSIHNCTKVVCSIITTNKRGFYAKSVHVFSHDLRTQFCTN